MLLQVILVILVTRTYQPVNLQEPQTDLSDVLISPCIVMVLKWIHRKCLAKWIETSKHESCQECHYKYKFHEVYANKWHN